MRTIERKDELGEVFTPPETVDKIIQSMCPESFHFSKAFLDPTCGNGNILVEVTKHRLKMFPENALQIIETTFGVDIMQDNINDCHTKLKELFSIDIDDILKKNIICCDFFKCNWDFDGEQEAFKTL